MTDGRTHPPAPGDPREKVRLLPTTPGVYLMKDARPRHLRRQSGQRSRVGSYFNTAAAVDRRTCDLVPEIADVDVLEMTTKSTLCCWKPADQGHPAAIQPGAEGR
ncbi:MAG: hypothetical protein U0992_12055 [Planctomycetaceae bacterium]